MMERFKDFVRKYGVRIVIVLLSMLFLCTFISRKEGYHMDEILAFQLANAEYNPWIVPTQPVGRLAKFMAEHIDGDTFGETVSNIVYIIKDTLTNRGNSILANYKADVYEAPVWISRDMFQDYLQCDSNDDFNLFSVYFNVKDDNHPPLHFMLLHLVTSLFRGEISVWHGCVINLAAVAGTLWLLGMIGDIIFKRKCSAAALMILYGFSMGAVGTALWIRMYGLLTLWTVWGLYLHLKKYTEVQLQVSMTEKCDTLGMKKRCIQRGFLRLNTRTGKEKWISSPAIFSVTLVSFWTQYFGLFFILPLAVVTIVLLARAKRMQELWAYIRTMVTAALVGVCVYPFAIGDVLFSSRGTEALGQWKNGFGEFIQRLLAFGNILGENVAGNGWLLLLIIAVPLAVLIVKSIYKKKMTKASEERGADGKGTEFYMCWIPLLVYFLLAAKMSPYFVDRYIMAIFPVTTLVIIWLADRSLPDAMVKQEKVLNGQNDKNILQQCSIVLLAILLVVIQNVRMGGQHTYLYTGYSEQLAVAEDYREYPCVCLYPGFSFYENIMEMERFRSTILIKNEELGAMDESRTQIAKEGYIALIKYPGEENGKEQLQQIMEVFGGTQGTLLYAGGAYGDAVYLVEP